MATLLEELVGEWSGALLVTDEGEWENGMAKPSILEQYFPAPGSKLRTLLIDNAALCSNENIRPGKTYNAGRVVADTRLMVRAILLIDATKIYREVRDGPRKYYDFADEGRYIGLQKGNPEFKGTELAAGKATFVL